MHKSVLIGLFSLIVNGAIAQSFTQFDKSSNSWLTIQPKIGYSFSKSSFNIAGNERGENPNVLSELIWDPTNAIEYGADFTLKNKSFVLKADVLLNKTVAGNVSDIDYDGDNRTLPYSTLYLSNHKGSGYSLKLQPGYDWSTQKQVSFITYLSLDYSSRNLYILNDKDWRTNNSNYISGLNSYYKYKFPNYGAGAQVTFKFNSKWSGQAAAEGHFSKYYAYGHWNLIDDFEKPISYEHKGNGKKINTSLGLSYALNPQTNIGVNYHLNHFGVSNGKDYLYTKSEGLMKSRLNDAKETKHALLLSVNFTLPFAN